MLKAVCVYCGSASGKRPAYAESARALARLLAERDITLVYGGAKVGLMGILADTALSCGGRVVGIIPQSLVEKEVAHDGLSERLIVESMHERKARMVERADGFIALPGGLGTLDELFELWTWAQLGFHGKPFGLLDADAYFAPLIDFLDHAVGEGFVRPAYRELLAVDDDAARLLDRLEARLAPGRRSVA